MLRDVVRPKPTHVPVAGRGVFMEEVEEVGTLALDGDDAAEDVEAERLHESTHFLTVSSVRVVMSLPKVRSSNCMNTGPLSDGT